MDLTKLVGRIPHEGKGGDVYGMPNYSGCRANCLRCAFDAALAAVPQDTVEAVREKMWSILEQRFMAGIPIWPGNQEMDAEIRAVLAARPVRAVLDAGLLIQEWYAVHTSTGMSYINASPTKWFAAYAERLNAALDRQHAEPPATDMQHWPGCPRKGGIGECDCTGDFSGAKP